MSGLFAIYGEYSRLLAAIRDDLCRWECLYNEKPDAIFLSQQASYIMRRDFLMYEPDYWAKQPLYPVSGPVEPPVRERYETLFGIRVQYYAATGIEYYFARKGVLSI